MAKDVRCWLLRCHVLSAVGWLLLIAETAPAVAAEGDRSNTVDALDSLQARDRESAILSANGRVESVVFDDHKHHADDQDPMPVFVLGAMKAGTSAFCDYLVHHP